MKKNTIILSLLILLTSLSSCIYIDTDDDDDNNESIITLTVKTPSNNKSVKVGERLEVKIRVTDEDGIEKITLQIPNLGVDKVYNSSTDNIEINDTFIIKENDTKGKTDITVIVKDDDGNKVRETDDIQIE